jgi:hypothetical protein
VHIDVSLSRPRKLSEIRDEMEEVMHVLAGANWIRSGLVIKRPTQCPSTVLRDAYEIWFRTVSFDSKAGQVDMSYRVTALHGNYTAGAHIGTTCEGHFHAAGPEQRVRYHALRLSSIPTDIPPDDPNQMSESTLDDRLKVVDSCFFADIRQAKQPA